MKTKSLFFIVVAIACITLVSCGTKGKNEATETKTAEEEWEALDAFHEIMADVYHPLKDSGNIKPYKERSAEFAAEAQKLADSKLPAKVDNAKVKGLIASMSASAQGLDVAVKAGVNDGQVGELLEKIHTLFHQIQEEWYAGAAEEHEEHH